MHSVWNELPGFLARNWQELVGSLTGALCVWLLVKQNIWNWPIGITNNIFYIVIFYKSGLFADAGLQFVYIAISIYGWWNWLHGGLQHTELKVNTASTAGVIGYLAMAATATAALYWLLRRFAPSTVPFADGLTVALYLTAQFMMSKKIVHNWWVLDRGRRAGHRALHLQAPLSDVRSLCVLSGDVHRGVGGVVEGIAKNACRRSAAPIPSLFSICGFFVRNLSDLYQKSTLAGLRSRPRGGAVWTPATRSCGQHFRL